MAELNKLLDPKDVVFNESIRNTGAVSMQIARPLPNTLSGPPAAGSAGPAASRSVRNLPLPTA